MTGSGGEQGLVGGGEIEQKGKKDSWTWTAVW